MKKKNTRDKSKISLSCHRSRDLQSQADTQQTGTEWESHNSNVKTETEVTSLIKGKGSGRSVLFCTFCAFCAFCTLAVILMTSTQGLYAQAYTRDRLESKGGVLNTEQLNYRELEGNQFSRWNARERNNKYDLLLKESMRVVYLITRNYGGSLANAQNRFAEVQRIYKVGKYYQNRRYYMAAQVEFDASWNLMRDLVRDYERLYRDRLLELVGLSADRLTDADLEISTRYEAAQKSPPRYIERNDYRLRVANYHLDEGARHNFYGRHLLAITHYRLGKIFAIHAIEGLELDAEKRKQIRGQYEQDLRDARRLYVTRANIATPPPAVPVNAPQ